MLEHHHNVDYDTRGDDEPDAHALATENWDAPVVVTTNVQFFESLFSNRTSRCRKLHNIANSVLIFDEAQMLPVDLLLPCVHAIEELVRNHRCTAVLCSATQPALRRYFDASVEMREICSDPAGLYHALRRVRFCRLGRLDDAALLERLNGHRQALCVVNTKVQAQALYEGLAGEGNFHLSTFMTPTHRRRRLEEIRQRLNDGLPCRVISTSLVEAGVDLDFPCVYREEAGLDSMIQAAGRCNREGKLPPDDAKVYLFRADEQYKTKRPRSLDLPIAITKLVMGGDDDAPGSIVDIDSPEAIYDYFNRFFYLRGDSLDEKGIVKALNLGFVSGLNIPFAKVAKDFRVIDAPTRTVLIPEDDEASKLIAALRTPARSADLLRKAGLHAVSVYPGQYELLRGAGALELLDDELSALRDPSGYSDEVGLRIPKGGIGIYT